jgi:hypothetical protein
MSTPKKSGKHWMKTDDSKLREMAKHGKPTGLIAWELDRSKDAIYNRASDKGISLHPTNKSPYNRPASGKKRK